MKVWLTLVMIWLNLAAVDVRRQVDPVFSANECYPQVRSLGQKAFSVYKGSRIADFGDKAGVCNYGFYHGFMSGFLESFSEAEADGFCQKLNQTQGLAVADACYQGLGRSAIYLVVKDIASATATCNNVTGSDEHNLKECLAGVYAGLTDLVFEEYGAASKLTPSQWYGLCLSQPEAFQPVCYENIGRIVFVGSGGDFSSLVDYIVNDPKIVFKKEAVRGLSAVFMTVNEGNLEVQQQGLLACQKLNPELKNACLETMSFKIWQKLGHPQTWKSEVSEFCAFESLSQAEKEVCLFGNNQPLREEFLKND